MDGSAGPSWLDLATRTGAVHATGVTNLDLLVDAADLAIGSHTGLAEVTSNDPLTGSTSVVVCARVVDVPGYTAWRTNVLGSGVSGDGYRDDFDGDRTENVLEFLTRGTVGPDSALLTPMSANGVGYEVALTWRKGAADTLLLIQICSDLEAGHWITLREGAGYAVQSRTSLDEDYERVVLRITGPAAPAYVRFVAAL
jgi:hypothetical protein